VIDIDGFRFNIGIIVANNNNRLLWARRIRQNGWQFPQGGLQDNETPEQALFRELYEELGLLEADVKILSCTRDWLYYRLPDNLIRRNALPLCIGQKQKWYMLRLVTDETHVQLDHTDSPEFDSWRWVTYWYPLRQAIFFKRAVYRSALQELAPALFNNNQSRKVVGIEESRD
jgi:putative (di)nucleoside polyphosphate hydrolase